MSNDELKPVRCGCGGASNIVKRLSRDYSVPVWYVECIKCNIETDDYFSEAEAVEAWNRAMGATDICVGDNERTAKVTLLNTGLHTIWGTCECGRQVEKPGRNDQSGAYYCPRCGARLEWK